MKLFEKTTSLAFGGMAATSKRATHAEAVLRDAEWHEATAQAAMIALGNDYAPLSDMRATSNYRLEAAKNNIHDVGRMCTDAIVGLAGFAVDDDNIIIEQNLVHDIGRYGPGEFGCQPATHYWQYQDHGIPQQLVPEVGKLHAQRRFDLSQLDAEAPDLHLLVRPAGVHHGGVRIPGAAGQVNVHGDRLTGGGVG